MQDVDTQVMVPIHLRNQIRGGDVEEVSRCERHQKSEVQLERHRVGEDSADQESQRREKAYDERSPATPATVDQHTVLAEFLGNFMGCSDEPGGNAESDVDDQRGSDRDSAEKIVNAVADHHHGTQRALDLGRVAVPMVPMQKLLESQKCGEADHHP